MHNVIARSDGFTIELREINRQKGGRGPDALKHQRTFVPGTAGPRRTAGGVVPNYLAESESSLPSLHVTHPGVFQERIAVHLEVGAYGAAVRSGPTHSRARWHQKQAADSVYSRAGREAFTIIAPGDAVLSFMYELPLSTHGCVCVCVLCLQQMGRRHKPNVSSWGRRMTQRSH